MRAGVPTADFVFTADLMTADGQPTTQDEALDERRRAAFVAAHRHSRRVRLIRVGIIAAVALGVAGLAGALFLGGRKQPEGISLGSIGVEGSRVTMSAPRLTGFRSDSRPYEVTARAATQDIKAPSLIDLQDLDARIGMGDQGSGHVTARKGLYDSVKETLRLTQDVVMRTDRGYELRMSEGDIDFKAGSLVTDNPVEAQMKASTVAADRLRVSDGGRKLVFEGRVRSVLKSQTPADPAAQPKGASK
jgi:lipopolysaccharide export system protein LptC